MDIFKLFILFWCCSILGWIMEAINGFIRERKLVNRGFLIGPYCPIYGSGTLILLLIYPYKDQILVCFVLGLVLCSVLEYIVSFIMEKVFGIRWWDYSNDAFNINGRVCLRNAIAFGALGVIFTRFIYPFYTSIIDKFSDKAIIITSIIIFIITMIDVFISFNAMSKIKGIIDKNIDKFKNKDATIDVKKLISQNIPHINYLEKRLIETYHLFGKEKEHIKKTIKIFNEKTRSGYGLFIVFLIIGLVVGLILSLYFELGSYKIIIPFTLSVSSLIAAIILKVGNK